MRKQLILLLGSLVLAISCKYSGSENIQIEEHIPHVELKDSTEINNSDIYHQELYIENEYLQNQLFFELKELTKNPLFIASKHPIYNRHVDNLIDTIITFKYDKSEVNIYKAASEKWIYHAEINNPKLNFLDSIKVGMKKQILENILGVELHSETVIIGDLEQTSIFRFTFQENLLEKIQYEGYID